MLAYLVVASVFALPLLQERLQVFGFTGMPHFPVEEYQCLHDPILLIAQFSCTQVYLHNTADWSILCIVDFGSMYISCIIIISFSVAECAKRRAQSPVH